MKEVIIFRRDDTLSPSRALYYKDLLYRVLKIGTEIEATPPKGMTRLMFEERVRDKLQPSGNVDKLGQWGVLDVEKEHCGIEIRVIGRHPYFQVLYEQYAYITGVIEAEGGRMRPTCGTHFHVLPSGLAEPVPEIILANIWNLTRRYAPYLKFLTSGGDKPEALCRRRSHNSHLEMVKYTPAVMTMRQIKETLDNSSVVPKHQNFLNLEHLTFTDRDEVHDFHLEFRFPDADLSSTSLTAKTFLFLAIVLKSVEMSQYGVIHTGKFRAWKRKQELLDMLNNNDGDLATSDTSGVTPEVIEELRGGCRELLELLKPVFIRFGHNLSFEALSDLAETPLSLRRIQGLSWQAIEQQLLQKASLNEHVWEPAETHLMRLIELAELTNFPAQHEWKVAAAESLLCLTAEVDTRLKKIASFRYVQWDPQLGTFIFLN